MTVYPVLYIDPDSLQRQHFQSIMLPFGFKVSLAANGEQALADKGDYAVVVFDVGLTDMDRLELVSKLNQRYPVAVFLQIGEELGNCWELNIPQTPIVMQYLSKPWQPKVLADTLRRTLEQRARSRIPEKQSTALVSQDSLSLLDILLIEDCLADADLLRDQLSSWKGIFVYQLTCMDSLNAALTCLAKQDFSLILCDLNLPDSQGLATLSCLLATSDIPIVVLSGQDDEQLALDAIQLGAQDCLCKNAVSSISLRRVISHVVERERLHGDYRRLLQQMPGPILMVDAQGLILFANQTTGVLFKCQPETLIGQTFGFPLISDEPIEIELSSGAIAQMRVVESRWRGRYARIISLVDVSVYKRRQNELQHEAYHDPLTGLSNRKLLEDRIEQAILRGQRSGNHFGLFMLDLDHFKQINDTMGHEVGDQVLQYVAQILLAAVRGSDTVARFGGDEFILIAQGLTDNHEANLLAHKIQLALSKPLILTSKQVTVSASIGIALFPSSGQDVQTLLRHADRALYLAKHSGRNVYRIYDVHNKDLIDRSTLLANELTVALTDEQFCLDYQPQFSSSGLVSAEALLRWEHPQRGLIMPAEFVPLLEGADLLSQVEQWILRQSIEQLVLWRQQMGNQLCMTVKLSEVTLQNRALPSVIECLINKQGLTADCLTIEITEMILLRDHDLLLDTLSKLNEMGIKLVLDNFGVSYGALSHLLEFSYLSGLKLDAGFAVKMDTEEGRLMIKKLIGLAHSLGLQVIASCVDTPEQYQWLEACGCNTYQGNLFAPPLHMVIFEDMHTDWQGWPQAMLT